LKEDIPIIRAIVKDFNDDIPMLLEERSSRIKYLTLGRSVIEEEFFRMLREGLANVEWQCKLD
jgi:hypothetical protein